MKMMVGDNLGETQLQQLVDRQLAGQPRGEGGQGKGWQVGSWQCCSWLSICWLWNPIDNYFFRLPGSPTTKSDILQLQMSHMRWQETRDCFPIFLRWSYPNSSNLSNSICLVQSQQSFFLKETISCLVANLVRDQEFLVIFVSHEIPWILISISIFTSCKCMCVYIYIYIYVLYISNIL